MKRFGLGLIIGSLAGVAMSLLKDENGKRLGQSLKENVEGMQKDAADLATAIKKAKKASSDLTENMPAAERAISDISDDIEHYQTHTADQVANMQHDVENLSKKFDSKDKKN